MIRTFILKFLQKWTMYAVYTMVWKELKDQICRLKDRNNSSLMSEKKCRN